MNAIHLTTVFIPSSFGQEFGLPCCGLQGCWGQLPGLQRQTDGELTAATNGAVDTY